MNGKLHMTPAEFIAKWQRAELKERSAAQEHFLDLCRMVGHKTPAEADPAGESFCFERGAAKHGGGGGFADVWKRGFFGWEYKGKHKDLVAAYDQLLRYRDALESPPLLVVSDMDRIVIHTNFTGTVSAAHEIPLASLAVPRSIEIIRNVFFDPEKLRPGRTSLAVTQEAASHFADISASMRDRGLDPAAVAHFLDRIIFCLFAEDTGLLPDMVFTRIVDKAGGDMKLFGKFLGQLFDAMAGGGFFGMEIIRHFNGNLFNDCSVLEISLDEMKRITVAAALDWSAIDPSIFGTLFERGMDPVKRSLLGAHFTGREDIEVLVDAVVMTPLRKEWHEVKAACDAKLAAAMKTKDPSKRTQRKNEAKSIIHRFLGRLAELKILDPACGSGNFLYIALLKLKDLEKEVILYASDNLLGEFLPMCGPWQLYGIEKDPYAHDLAQMTVWIGWIQWIRANGFGTPSDPILRPLVDNIRLMDAILAPDGSEPQWPEAEFIVGNPPFLGTKKLRSELGDEYVEALFGLYGERIPNFSDLCCYWFEKARAHIAAGKCQRAGLLATQGIRGGLNRVVLKRIKDSGSIFWAESDRPWVLDGANVHVSMVGFDDGAEGSCRLDGASVASINPDLTALSNTTEANRLGCNCGIGFIADVKAGEFDVPEAEALGLLSSPNPHGSPNSDVLLPWINSLDVLRRERHTWIIDFGTNTPLEETMLYERPYEIVNERVRPERAKVQRERYGEIWWLHARPCPEMRKGVSDLPRFLATPTVAKHRVFIWSCRPTLPDHQLVVFARSDDYFFGILHSRIHEVWSLRMGTRLETRPRYTPTTCFETFPFPDESLGGFAALRETISSAAKDLNTLRENWLNPPEWTRTETLEFPGTVGGPWDRYVDPATVEDRGTFRIGTVRYPRLVPRDAECAVRLKDCTLTKLYNARPAWLADCHARLDAAVAAAYGWPADMTDDQILERLLALNLEQAEG
jgi:hypothetical protein